MTAPAAQGAVTLARAQARGVWRAAGSYLFAVLLLVALSWLTRPELALLTTATQQLTQLRASSRRIRSIWQVCAERTAALCSA